METLFFFMDESGDVRSDTAYLTTVVVPAEQYVQVRDGVIQVAVNAQASTGLALPHPIELHGVAMLRDVPGATDDHRIEAFEQIVDLVNREELEVISVGHTGVKEISRYFERRQMPQGDKLYHLNFEALLDVIHVPSDALIVPVFDGVPGAKASGKRQPVDKIAQEAFIDGAHVRQFYRVAAAEPGWYVRNFRNIAEPTFSDSAQSPMLQLADVVSYLLGALDSRETERTEFKGRLAAAAARFDTRRVHRIPHSLAFQSA